jgi:hypothetical protein
MRAVGLRSRRPAARLGGHLGRSFPVPTDCCPGPGPARRDRAMVFAMGQEHTARPFEVRWLPGVVVLRDIPARLAAGETSSVGWRSRRISCPQVMAYAEVAGLTRRQSGCGRAWGSLAVYAVLGSSRQLSVGPESTTALMTAAAVAPLAGRDPEVYLPLRAVGTRFHDAGGARPRRGHQRQPGAEQGRTGRAAAASRSSRGSRGLITRRCFLDAVAVSAAWRRSAGRRSPVMSARPRRSAEHPEGPGLVDEHHRGERRRQPTS